MRYAYPYNLQFKQSQMTSKDRIKKSISPLKTKLELWFIGTGYAQIPSSSSCEADIRRCIEVLALE